MPSPEHALDAPLQNFSDCHVGIVGSLQELGRLAHGQLPAAQRRDAAGRVLHFYREAILNHHQEEETQLFPCVMTDAIAGPERERVDQAIAQLVAEHREVETRFAQLLPALKAIDAGGEALLDTLAVDALVARYLAHARFEEEQLLPLAQAILGRRGDHMAALGLSLHMRHASAELRRRYGAI